MRTDAGFARVRLMVSLLNVRRRSRRSSRVIIGLLRPLCEDSLTLSSRLLRRSTALGFPDSSRSGVLRLPNRGTFTGASSANAFRYLLRRRMAGGLLSLCSAFNRRDLLNACGFSSSDSLPEHCQPSYRVFTQTTVSIFDARGGYSAVNYLRAYDGDFSAGEVRLGLAGPEYADFIATMPCGG